MASGGFAALVEAGLEPHDAGPTMALGCARVGGPRIAELASAKDDALARRSLFQRCTATMGIAPRSPQQ